MYRTLVILNDAPYGSERSYNGLRLADTLARKEGMEARGMTADMLAEGVHKGTLEELTDWTLWSDRILNF